MIHMIAVLHQSCMQEAPLENRTKNKTKFAYADNLAFPDLADGGSSVVDWGN